MRTILALCLLAAGVAEANPPSPVVGKWGGALDLGAFKLRLLFKIVARDDKLAATMDSLDQGANDIPVASATFADGTLTLELPRIGARYVGKLDGQRLVGDFTQGGATRPLVLTLGETPALPRRPQTPKAPFPYEALDVTLRNEAAKVTLGGTLTKPRGPGPFAVAVMATGSGTQDRDETLFGHKPFWVIADALTRRGLAVLRLDDRGAGKSTGDPRTSTTLDSVDDILAAVTWLKARPDVRADRIGIIGHSEGGVIAFVAAARSPDIGFIVSLAGSTLPGDEILAMQTALLLKAKGASDADVASALAAARGSYAIIKAAKSEAEAKLKLRVYVDKLAHTQKPDVTAAELKAAGDEAERLTLPWVRTFLTLDPRTYLEKVRCPVLALNGGNDLQVPAKENLSALLGALARAHNTDVSARELPGLNHLFQHSASGSPSDYGTIEETFAPEALELIGDWLVARTKQ